MQSTKQLAFFRVCLKLERSDIILIR